MDLIDSVAQAGKDPLAGSFRLGVICTIVPYLLSDLISVLRQVAPGLSLYIEESMSSLAD